MADPYNPAPKPPSSVSLTSAREAAGISDAELARQCRVSESTVADWISDRSTPGLEHRRQLAKLVDVPTRKLWPDLVEPEHHGTRAEYDKLIAIPPETWTELLIGANNHIDMLGGGYGWWLEQNPNFASIIEEKHREGANVQVRICQADPDGNEVRQRDAQEAERTNLKAGSLRGGIETAASMWTAALDSLDHAELRLTEHAYDLSLFRFDDWLIVSPYLMGQRGLLTYAELVHRTDVGTKFDQLIEGHFEPIWTEARSPSP